MFYSPLALWLLTDNDLNVNPYSDCSETANDSIRQVEYYPMGASYDEGRFQLFFKAIVCAMYMIDKERGSLQSIEYYQDIQGAISSVWLNYDIPKNEHSAVEYIQALARLGTGDSDLSNYPDIVDAIKSVGRLQSSRWGITPSRETSEAYQRVSRPLNQALSYVSRYHRKSQKTYFLRPQISKKNVIRLGIGIGVLTLALAIRGRGK
jgi:hypothetical protein